MNRLGRGYSFEALRAKILFTEGVSKVRKPKFQRPRREQGMAAYECFTGEPSTIYQEREINFGVGISTLVRLIEEGDL